MTYCVALRLNAGMVFLSDSRVRYCVTLTRSATVIPARPSNVTMCRQASSACATIPSGSLPSGERPGVPEVTSHLAPVGTSTASR